MGNKVNVENTKVGQNPLLPISGTTLAMSRRLSCLTKAIIRFTRFQSLKTRWQQLKATSDSDYYAFFCDKIGNVYGIVHTAQKEKKVEQDDSFVQSSTQESVGVEDVRWGGFDCEKITRVTGTENDLSAGMKAIGDLFGTKSSMDNSIKDLKHIETTDIVWIEKNSGAVVHRKFSVKGGAGMGNYAERMKPQPSVTLLTFSPDPSLIPTSQEGYKLVK